MAESVNLPFLFQLYANMYSMTLKNQFLETLLPSQHFNPSRVYMCFIRVK